MSAPPLLLSIVLLLFSVPFKVFFSISGSNRNIRIRAVQVPLASSQYIDSFLLVVAVLVPAGAVTVGGFRVSTGLGLLEHIKELFGEVVPGLLSLLVGIFVVPPGIFAFVFAIPFAFAITFALVFGSVPTTAFPFVGAGTLKFG